MSDEQTYTVTLTADEIAVMLLGISFARSDRSAGAETRADLEALRQSITSQISDAD